MRFFKWLRCYLMGHCTCIHRVNLTNLGVTMGHWEIRRCCYCGGRK